MTATDPARTRRRAPEVPPHEKDLLTLAEASALGYGCVRLLQQWIRDGRIKRALVPIGNGEKVQRFKLHRQTLLEELRGGA